MRKVVRWDDDGVITRNRLRMRDNVIPPDDIIGLEEIISR
jgi:hypothetical protein